MVTAVDLRVAPPGTNHPALSARETEEVSIATQRSWRPGKALDLTWTTLFLTEATQPSPHLQSVARPPMQ